MNKVYLIFLFFSCLKNCLYSQSVINMTSEVLEDEAYFWDKRDTLRRIDVLNEVVFKLQNNLSKFDTLQLWASEALELAKIIQDTSRLSDAFARLALIADKSGNLNLAISSYKKALVIRRHILKKYSQAASICNNLGLVYEKQKDSTQIAIMFYREGLKLLSLVSESRAKKSRKARIMNNLGELLGEMGSFDSALTYLDSSLSIRENIADSLGIGNTLLNKGLLFKKIGNRELSENNLKKSLAIFEDKRYQSGIAKSTLALGDLFNISGKHDTAIKYYEESLSYSDNLDFDDLGTVLQNKGISHFKLGELREAEKNYMAALKLFEEAQDTRRIALLYYNYGSFYYEQGHFELAINEYKKSIDFGGSHTDVSTKISLLNYLGKSYMGLGVADSSLKYLAEYAQLKDSLTDAYQDAMDSRYNLALAENEIQKLTLEKERENQKKLKTYGLIGFSLSWLILGLLLMAYYLTLQRRRLTDQRFQISQQKIIELMREKELERNYAWISGVEVTRKKIGQELHDSIGSMLSIVKVYFSSLDKKMDGIQKENQKYYEKANHLLDNACEKVRQLSHEMTSAILVKFGLRDQLEALTETLKETGKINVELATHGLKERFETSMEFNIYRIIQELVNNVVKHAKASLLSIQVNRFEEVINIMIEDNGIGFEVNNVKEKGGIGITNVLARVHEMEGKLHIDSSIGKGTSVSIDIPIYSDHHPLIQNTNK